MEFIAILTAAIGGGAIFGFIEFLIQRNDNNVLKKFDKRFDELDGKIDKMDKLFSDRMDDLNKKIDNNSADNARIRILQFSQESQRGYKHSKESFDQVHLDIDNYKKHCQKYEKDYPNSRAEQAIINIERLYQEALQLEEQGKEGFLI